MIPFNKSCITGKEIDYISDCINTGQLHGDGKYTKLCQDWFYEKFNFKHNLLTTSCSTSLDLSALLISIKVGDEVIMPSYTFVSTANSFVARGAKIKFVDIDPKTMNIDTSKIQQAISKNTKAIVPVHYAGVSCEMDAINEIAKENSLFVIEDAAQGMMSKYKGQSLGGIGDIGCYSFHGTKNYTSGGEGGLVVLKTRELFQKAEIIREKGTNRSQFLNGEVDKYTWVDLGSSLLPSDISAAFLYGQLESAIEINTFRLKVWSRYNNELKELNRRELIVTPFIPEYCEHNAHMYYLKLKSSDEAKKFISFMRDRGVTTPFHYVPLHSSPAGKRFGDFVGEDLYTTKESSRLVRLPIYFGITDKEVSKVIEEVYNFFK